jgi:hypothetical protein
MTAIIAYGRTCSGDLTDSGHNYFSKKQGNSTNFQINGNSILFFTKKNGMDNTKKTG